VQAVADPAHGLDAPVLRVPQLLAEVADVDLDVVLVAEEVVAPDLVEDALAGMTSSACTAR